MIEQKASLKLLDLLEERNYYILPKYPFNKSFDEVVMEVYWNDKEESREVINLKEKLEEYSKWCLNNIELLEKENR